LGRSYYQCSSKNISDKSVDFSDAEFHYHVMMLGDNPSVTTGPPVTIEWECLETFVFTVDEMETLKPVRRRGRELMVPRQLRQEWLLRLGYSRGEIAKVQEKIRPVQKSRATCAQQHFRRELREARVKNLLSKAGFRPKKSIKAQAAR
jgi:hypothetical protein